MKKKIYSLTYCYEGDNNCFPYVSTLAVSYDRKEICNYMKECIDRDCRTPDDESELWNDDCNYSICKKYDDEVYLKHNANNDVYVIYKIHEVEIL